MVIEFKNTPEGYKSTELGDIPLDWSIKSIDEIGRVYGGLSGKSKEDFEMGDSKFISYKNVFDNFFIDTNKLLPVNIKLGEKQNKVQEGDIIFTGSSETANEAGMSSVLINKVNHDIYLNSFCFGLRTKPNVLNPYFSGYLFRSFNFRKEIFSLAQGSTRFNISKSNFLKLKVIIPPIKEQQKIAEILLAADKQIEKTELLVQKTKEFKKGLMQNLLTKGVGHTQFKSSDLGEIPIEWNVVQFNDICSRIIVGIASSTSQYYTTEKAVPILRNQNIKENKIRAKDVLYITKEFDEMNYKKRLRKGDILTVRTGYPGLTAVVPSEFEEAQSFTTLISSPNPVLANSHYLAYYMNSEIGKKDLTGLSAGGAQQNLNVRSLSTFKLKLPPLAEQAQIVDVLSSIDTQIEIYEKEKGKQIELKKALMQQLLTGKLRVTV
ncbi:MULTISPECIES: restriction endonuclease subunit S [unclassified Planococcus (in: firmicutes)]|uniref:restriction endonuclease subunit S n=1 Tax=unclassified Planococcus (in: firmicutes) TaxID=2662419 RepID=UPI000C3291F6|nr:MULTISPECIES: restriction endonuclease subunit S [unclassified Planococcus (in: firmicutes)]AUD14962.1 hypothetical protein CW734_16440 [Planococcus sp. MB-3u-03]PKG47099.1 hypothetical protein CXF66_04680 [Planococcus sp. Urea-trap-24]PKG87772.1 hypothetical protein CXF91_17530 [Planococcus sp. Urea-3u-39]PKH35430.1 hypothetical protein CXF77_17210 [Planococcus sp. MB-3u-09]